MRFFPTLILLLACAGDPIIPVDGSAVPEPPPATRTQSPTEAVHEVRVTPIGHALAENGLGERRASDTAIAIDIETEGWPGRAMEPVLVVGDLRFTSYTHSSPTVLRFVVDRPELLPEGTEAVVRYGSQEFTRFTLPNMAAGQ